MPDGGTVTGVKITITRFELEKGYDFLEIGGLRWSGTDEVLFRKSGDWTDLPSEFKVPFMVNEPDVVIRFTSDSSEVRKGFELS